MRIPNTLEEKAEVLKALAHPARLCIVKGLLDRGTSNVTYMQQCMNLPQSTISQHIARLRSSGIIHGTRKGLEIQYEVVNQVAINIVNAIFEENEK